MPHYSPVVFAIALVGIIVAVTALARRLPIPTPILQMAAGLALGFVPGLTVGTLEPDLIFFVFLPPIIWAAAFFTSVREFRANFRTISRLAVGLVVATTAAVAVVAHRLFPGMPWPVAVALGAIVSPPDAVAAAAIVSRLPVPRRVVVVLEGESLVNDASALVLYRTAVAAAVTGSFSWGESIVRFFVDAAVGSLVGLLVGWLVIRAIRWTKDALAETLLTLVAPYLAWIASETLHVSAVLACVAGGLYARQHLSTTIGAASRVQTRQVWDLAIFLLNATIFLILGAQVGGVVRSLPRGALLDVLGIGAIVGVVAIVVRLAWVPVGTAEPARQRRVPTAADGAPRWKSLVVMAWTSMRGIVSLATALALPTALANGRPFPYRAEIIVVTMCVIVMTLVVQGLTLAPLIRMLGFTPEQTSLEEERLARRETLRRGTEALQDLAQEDWVDARDVAWLEGELRDRTRLLDHHHGGPDGRRRLRAAVIGAERTMLIRLRDEGAISDEVSRELEQELDLEAIRIGADA